MNRKRHTFLALTAMVCFVLPTVATEPQKSTDAQPHIPPQFDSRFAESYFGRQQDRELPKFEEVAKDYEMVVSTADGKASLYTLYTREKDSQMLAELPKDFENQRVFIAYTIAGGIRIAGVQMGDTYAYWKKYDKQLALIEPNVEVRTSGDLESTKGRDRVFTDRVILSVPVECIGPNGGPVIDVDRWLVGQSEKFFNWATQGADSSLTTIVKAKAFPNNVEISFELPLREGRLGTLSYSISVIPENTGYAPRVADTRIGFFATTHRDVGKPGADTPWVRYINRWKLEKADPKLNLSPPKEPIVFYLEHTIPVRYRRWVRDGVLEWNKAFANVGIANAIEVYQQDARTGAHMEKDPEDARYNFVLWTNAGMGFAIGPSRVDPRTGQILDADIVMDEGFITSWVRAWHKLVPDIAMESFGPETYVWLESRPEWDPRILLAAPSDRENVKTELAQQRHRHNGHLYGGHPAVHSDPTLMGDEKFDGLSGRVSQINGACMNAYARSIDVAMFRLGPDIFAELAYAQENNGADNGDDDTEEGKPKKEEGDILDGVPEWFIGPLLKDVVMHEVGHTLGLRHNFKASSIYSLKEINSPEMKGVAQTASVMDYNPININMGDGPVQGDYTMVTVGPYDMWAIEYGYSQENDLKPILKRVSEESLPYLTDEDTWGPDPLARRFDYGANPLDYADSQMRLVQDLRTKILDRMVKEGDSWAKAREGYELLLSRQFFATAIAANWIGGSHVNRDKKGDPGDRDPVVPVSLNQQRRALTFIINNMFKDESFGLTPELLGKMTVDKWWDEGGFYQIFDDPSWPVHDRIKSLQSVALTMILNPTTLNRVLDNEFRIPSKDDALTLPEVIFGITDAIWTELETGPNGTHTSRQPMISSLRRNLQRENLERLIGLMLPNKKFGASAKQVATLCSYKLRDLDKRIEKVLKTPEKIDPYTVAHLTEAQVRIQKSLDAQYLYNIDDVNRSQSSSHIHAEPASK